MKRSIRYQAAIVREEQMLLIKHSPHDGGRAYWLLPGGGQEGEETPEDCVVREAAEETNLRVRVMRFLSDEPDIPGGSYERLHTYLCEVVDGVAAPGFEPEEEAAQEYAISAVHWLNLRDGLEWSEIGQDDFTRGIVSRISGRLGF